MAANNFATMLSRNTNKITVILVYAFLEWLLIFFLFLHSLSTHLLVNFASYFGLKQLCLFCARLDRLFERNPEPGFTCKELICENHAAGLSDLSFCKTHRKLAQSMKMCPDCSDRDKDKTSQRSIGCALCPCCQRSLEEKTYPNYLLIKSSSWGNSLGYKENGGLILEMIDDDKIGDEFEKERESGRLDGKGHDQNNGEVISDVGSYGLSLREMSEEDGLRSISTNFPGNEDEISEIQHSSGQLLLGKDDYSLKIIDLSDHEILACGPDRLIPVELIDSSTITNQKVIRSSEENHAPEAELKDNAGNVPMDTDGSNQNPVCDRNAGHEEETEGADLLDDQSGTKKLISKPEDESLDPLLTDRENEEEKDTDDDQEEEGDERTEERMEEKLLPETPTSGDTLKSLHKKILLLDRKREPSAEESVDESELDSEDPFQTIERLRNAVKVEREALRVLYAELEEERSASAIAANQTMAMITRLQEEKAKVHMEALQYQRMMEEQAEYDQEALQLLNDLMVKREKEKEELHEELEVYRKKVLEYEAREKNKTVSENADGEGSAHDDVDDKNEDDGEQDDSSETDMDLEKITMDCVKHMSMLDESLSEFEEERLTILDQLKVLEEKLLTMQEDESADTSKFPGEISNSCEANETSNGFSERLTMASMAKSLLPLLDAAENETEDGFQEEPESIERDDSLDNEKLEIIKQVDNVYERLQALETDGEFLKNCVSSVKKDDKGMDLLQEILQHLNDLRNIELNGT
ncbi:PREDICTED: myosin-binding protein 3 isoform X2 [Tarenaya hassleriana]|uniref:myosin-binding protein 3 isoform X2 n=1 Tax=Tarenaya hassleriana TaxID=28532 RepID=UPI00053C464A|nr:PREDICTED: myosin-binding protein 3 isoform X2 [Tarenaya hassleriana]